MLDRKKYPPVPGYISITDTARIIRKTRQNTRRILIKLKIKRHQIGATTAIMETDLKKILKEIERADK